MKKILLLPIICIAIFLSSCNAKQQLEYYSNPDNYITVVGTVTHIKYNEERDSLYLGLHQIPTEFSDNSFKIVGENLLEIKVELKITGGIYEVKKMPLVVDIIPSENKREKPRCTSGFSESTVPRISAASSGSTYCSPSAEAA